MGRMSQTLRLAVAQSTAPEDPSDRDALRRSGLEIRVLTREASAAGARLVQFPEGAISYPDKYVVSGAAKRSCVRRIGRAPLGT
jgi:hypothetical protein